MPKRKQRVPVVTKTEKSTFVDLPLDIQRTIIDYCIANKVTTMVVDGKTYELPHLIQFTYRCGNQKCNEVVAARFFKQTVVNGSVSSTRQCQKCRNQMYISHRTAVLDYYLGPEKQKKLKGLMKYLDPLIQKEKEIWGESGEERD